jgi:hypothetical protein
VVLQVIHIIIIRMTEKHDGKIDAVITWVDGGDENHLRKKREVLRQLGNRKKSEVQTGRDQTRFVDNGELKYCIRSIRKHAPWINRIFLVTDNQRPDFINEKFCRLYNLTIVDHQDIFRGYEWALPTFNTRSIESTLWRIPGLAEKFIYFNDDFVIARDVDTDDFFTADSVVLRGKWKKIHRYGPLRLKLNEVVSFLAKNILGITRSMHLLLQIRSAELAGFDRRYFKVPHVPHPVRKSTLAGFFEKHPEKFEENIKYRFRNMNQFSAIFLAHHLEISNGDAVLKPPDDYLMINGETDFVFVLNRKLRKIRNRRIRFVCLQGLEMFKKYDQKRIKQTLKKDLGLKKMKEWNNVEGSQARQERVN